MEYAWLVLGLFLLVLDLWLRLFSCWLFLPLLLRRLPIVLHHLWASRRRPVSQRGHRIHVVRCPVLDYAHLVCFPPFLYGVVVLIDVRGDLTVPASYNRILN